MEVKTRGRKAKNWRIKFAVFLNLINRAVSRTFAVVKVVVYVIAMYLLAHVLPLFTPILWKLVKEKNCSGYSVEPRHSFSTQLAIIVVYAFVLYVCSISVATLFGLPFFMLIDMILVVTVHWIWTELPQDLLLTYTGIEKPHQVADKPLYRIDTTQRHYPRKRDPRYTYFSSKPLFSKENKIETDKDVPDVEEVPGNHCICSFVMKLQPPDPIHSFVVYFYECREDDAFYELCSAFDVPENIRVKIATNSSSMIIRCFDALHRVYHRDNELTLDTIKAKLSEYSDELQQIISDYHAG